ncbi:MAG: SMP-30/gluconolactonase/LRE family protein [Devosiaceae bacterium]|nr:SMP-30/gluconolactonase/LRE family protein [Devosiaceae bacterium]
MNIDTPECFHKTNAILGEGPLWDHRQDALFWIDISRPAVLRHDLNNGQTGHWPMPSAIGAIGLSTNNQLLLALENQHICLLDLQSGDLQTIANPIADFGLQEIGGRYNDGRVDQKGNFWVGWLTHDRKNPGALFRMDSKGNIKKILDDPIAPNGIGWSPDGTIMYVTDSHINTIWAYDCDLESGELGRRRMLARQDRNIGIFDGLCVDAQGNIWSALYGGGAVVKLSPNEDSKSGPEIARIELPVNLVTSCCFAGDDLKTMVITTAVRNQCETELQKYPLSGSLFRLPMCTPGLQETVFDYAGDSSD